MIQPKKIDFAKGYFNGKSGKKYIFNKTLSLERYNVYEELEIMLTFGRDANDIFQGMKKTHSLFNESKPGDAIVNNYNLMAMVKENLDKRVHPAIRMCALWCCSEDEDTSKYDEKIIKAKIDDWSEIDFQDLFQLALNLVRGYNENYNDDSLKDLKKTKVSLNTLRTFSSKEKKTGQKS